MTQRVINQATPLLFFISNELVTIASGLKVEKPVHAWIRFYSPAPAISMRKLRQRENRCHLGIHHTSTSLPLFMNVENLFDMLRRSRLLSILKYLGNSNTGSRIYGGTSPNSLKQKGRSTNVRNVTADLPQQAVDLIIQHAQSDDIQFYILCRKCGGEFD